MAWRSGFAWVAAGVLVAAIACATVMSAFPRTRRMPEESGTSAATPAPVSLASSALPARAPMPPPAVPAPRAGDSPLRNAPGYFPPADPESASVRLGRREAPDVPDLFQGGAASMEEFGRSVVTALNGKDEKALHTLRVTRVEFERILWREFPESRPITRITAEDAWSMSEPRSIAGAGRAVGLHGGRRLRFLTIESASIQTFTNFLLHRDVVIAAVDEGTAEVHKITMAPSVAERKGRFKALLYRD
ncbi:MAG: hypothetical protein AAB011_02475 [Candidatus Eisenbacteria bacterium]